MTRFWLLLDGQQPKWLASKRKAGACSRTPNVVLYRIKCTSRRRRVKENLASMRVRHIPSSVVKPFGDFGGMAMSRAWLNVLLTTGALFLSAALIADARSGAGGNAAGAYNCGEDGGGAEAGWIFQPVLGCEAGETVAGDRQVGERISLSERASGGHRVE